MKIIKLFTVLVVIIAILIIAGLAFAEPLHDSVREGNLQETRRLIEEDPL